MFVRCFKMTYQSNHFNLNQKVFVIFGTGDMAAYCYGRYRGKNRWVKAWVKWNETTKTPPEIKEIEIDENSHIAKVCGYSESRIDPYN